MIILIRIKKRKDFFFLYPCTDKGYILLMKKYYKDISWATYNLPQNLKRRGIDVVDKLPNFHYRDDSLKLWAAIKEFVTKILAIYYSSADDIVKVTNVYYKKTKSLDNAILAF